MKPLAFAITLAALPYGALAACLGYGSTVELRGTLERRTYPEQPNYTSIAQGDHPASYFFIVLKKPMCANKGSAEAEREVRSAKALQLMFESSASFAELRPFLGKHVVCNGKLWPQESGHHHSAVLLSESMCHPSGRG